MNKNPDFIFHQKTPPNGGPPLQRLIEKFATPVQDFFLRIHSDIPELDRSTFRLTVGGLVKRRCEFTLMELTERFPAKAMTATLQCAGNPAFERHSHQAGTERGHLGK